MKQKIVFITNNLVVGGVERLMRDILSRLDRNRLDISVITVWGSGPLAATYQSLNIPVHWAGGRTWYSSKNPLLKPYFAIISPITFVRLLFKLWQIRPDTVMTCLTQADILGTLAAWLCRIDKRIVRQADVKKLNPVVKWLKQWLALRLATGVIANSYSTRDFLQDYFAVPTEKITVIYNGIDIARFQAAARPLSTIGNLTLGYLGRLESIKGIDCLLTAVRILRSKYQLTPRTIILGDGSLKSTLVKYTEQYQLHHIRFAGEILDSVAEALRPIDILIVPSRSEGFGLAIVEGLAAGKLIVASDLPVMRELIEPNINGLLIKPGDSEALATTLHKLLADPEMLQRLGQTSQQWLKAKGGMFDIQRTARCYQDFLF